jgi:transposase
VAIFPEPGLRAGLLAGGNIRTRTGRPRSPKPCRARSTPRTPRAQGLAAVPADLAAHAIHAFKHEVLAGLSQVPKVPGRKQQPGRDLLQCLRDRQADVLRFTTGLRIPPTPNHAERDLRPAKTQQKISGRLRSEQVTRDRYAIRGYISTAAKRGAHVLTAIHDALEGDPWMPPIPSPP